MIKVEVAWKDVIVNGVSRQQGRPTDPATHQLLDALHGRLGLCQAREQQAGVDEIKLAVAQLLQVVRHVALDKRHPPALVVIVKLVGEIWGRDMTVKGRTVVESAGKKMKKLP